MHLMAPRNSSKLDGKCQRIAQGYPGKLIAGKDVNWLFKVKGQIKSYIIF